jgi:hypothetical protein
MPALERQIFPFVHFFLDSEVESFLASDTFVLLQDSSLRVRSVQNDRLVIVILSDSEESSLNFGIQD